MLPEMIYDMGRAKANRFLLVRTGFRCRAYNSE